MKYSINPSKKMEQDCFHVDRMNSYHLKSQSKMLKLVDVILNLKGLLGLHDIDMLPLFF